MKYGLIAGGGAFPQIVLQSAREQGHEMVAVAIREETDPEVERLADRCHWISLGELSKLIRIFQQEDIHEAIMAGRVQHRQIFSAIRPDWRLLKVLNRLRKKNTDSLIGAVAGVLEEEGIRLLDSTLFLKPHLGQQGANSSRQPAEAELLDIDYGLEIARALSAYDIGQTVVICERACVAVEAMEGTDAVILRAGEFSNGRRLTVVKVAKPGQDMRFDVPVIGPTTIRKMKQVGATAISVEAGKTLLIERDKLLAEADAAKIAVWGEPGPADG